MSDQRTRMNTFPEASTAAPAKIEQAGDQREISETEQSVPDNFLSYSESARSQCIACGHLQDYQGKCEQCGFLSIDEGFFN